MSDIGRLGSMTVILASSGAGKSTFLQALAGKLQDNSKTEIGAEILYLGWKGEDVDLIKLTHSGGEHKRVSTGEVLVGSQSLFLCDEISTGLDSAATLDIVNLMASWHWESLTISKGFNEHQFESPEVFKEAKSVANLARSKKKSEFGLAFVASTMLLLNRKIERSSFAMGKSIEALIIGLVMGMIYFDASSTYYLRLIFFSTALFERQARQQITISFQLRKVFYKQRPRSFFRTTSYAIAESVVHIPANMTVSFVLGTFFYFMSGLTRTFENGQCLRSSEDSTKQEQKVEAMHNGPRLLCDSAVRRREAIIAEGYCTREPGRMVALVVTVMDAIAVRAMNLVHETLDLSQFLVNGGLVVGGAEETRDIWCRVLCSRMSSRVSGRLIVMREVQSIACTGRTRFISLAFSIFELFKGLLLLQRGGFSANCGELGVDSVKMLDYFALIPGTEEIRPQYNPSTYGWCWYGYQP
ncbi:P-loop containing nucleoside triphosphate hydrolase [Phytophthora cactorum]|nr:P-loop containing nucleoside triphosphate hydrolase [Phytophthora cactorum]